MKRTIGRFAFLGILIISKLVFPTLLSAKNQTDPKYCNALGTELNTAIGCIPVFDQSKFLSFVLKWAIGVGSGIAFILMLYSGFMIMTAAGNPERLKAGQELLTSAIAGLILLIFSVFILRFIGVDILGIM